MKNISDKYYRENQNILFFNNFFFSKICRENSGFMKIEEA